MNSEISKVAGNNKAFHNLSVNQIILDCDASMENLSLSKYKLEIPKYLYSLIFFSVGDTLIDSRLQVPERYCQEITHRNCTHAIIDYDENFHKEDRVRSLDFVKLCPIPSPQTSYAVWKLLNDYTENRKTDEKNAFFVRGGQQGCNEKSCLRISPY